MPRFVSLSRLVGICAFMATAFSVSSGVAADACDDGVQKKAKTTIDDMLRETVVDHNVVAAIGPCTDAGMELLQKVISDRTRIIELGDQAAAQCGPNQVEWKKGRESNVSTRAYYENILAKCRALTPQQRRAEDAKVAKRRDERRSAMQKVMPQSSSTACQKRLASGDWAWDTGCLDSRSPISPVLAGAPQQPPAAPADCALAAVHWEAVEKMNSILAFQDHLDRFPNCAFATLAKLRIEALKTKH